MPRIKIIDYMLEIKRKADNLDRIKKIKKLKKITEK